MSGGNVIFLAHRQPEQVTSSTEHLGCGTCSNKTWVAIYDAKGNGFPRLRCACCGTDGGIFGWVNPDNTSGGAS